MAFILHLNTRDSVMNTELMNTDLQTPPYTDTGGALDYDSITMGMIVPPEQIEWITGTKSGTQEYQFAALKLTQKIQKELWDRGKCYTVHVRQASIAVCTDAEASAYNAQQRKIGQRKMLHAHRRNLHVEMSKLDVAQKAKHERELLYAGRALASMRSVRMEIQGATKRKLLPAPN